MDLAAGLTQVLSVSEGANTYLYGLGRIAQEGKDGVEYFHTDALGSLRQMSEGSAGVTLVRSYAPYGQCSYTAGAGATSYGFTGEWTDGYSGLVYLRARWYAPGQGRFLTRDSWGGFPSRPSSYNRWLYGYGNSVKYTDPSGHSPLLCGVPFIGCLDTAKNAVLAAKAAYSQVGPTLLALSQREPWNNRFNCLNPRWSKPERAIDLLADYFCERGPDWVVFNGGDALSQELARSVLLDAVRKEFYSNGDITESKEGRFNIPEFGMALLDAINVGTGEIFFPPDPFPGFIRLQGR